MFVPPAKCGWYWVLMWIMNHKYGQMMITSWHHDSSFLGNSSWFSTFDERWFHQHPWTWYPPATPTQNTIESPPWTKMVGYGVGNFHPARIRFQKRIPKKSVPQASLLNRYVYIFTYLAGAHFKCHVWHFACFFFFFGKSPNTKVFLSLRTRDSLPWGTVTHSSVLPVANFMERWIWHFCWEIFPTHFFLKNLGGYPPGN